MRRDRSRERLGKGHRHAAENHCKSATVVMNVIDGELGDGGDALCI